MTVFFTGTTVRDAISMIARPETIEESIAAAKRRLLEIRKVGWAGRGRDYYEALVADQNERIANLQTMQAEQVRK